MRNRLASMVLVFEAITVLLAIPVATQAALPLAVVALFCVVTAGVVRRPGGLLFASTLQFVLLALTTIVPAFVFVAVPYLLLWWYCLRIGSRIDRERLHGTDSSDGPDVP